MGELGYLEVPGVIGGDAVVDSSESTNSQSSSSNWINSASVFEESKYVDFVIS